MYRFQDKFSRQLIKKYIIGFKNKDLIMDFDNLSRAGRKFLLEKIAKKPNAYGISGKHNRKSLEKILAKSTSRHNELKSALQDAEAKHAHLSSFINDSKDELSKARKDIMQCHDLMRNMDFSNAHEVRVGKDVGDVAYSCDGKWMYYDGESGDKQPYSNWKKSKKAPEGEENLEEDGLPGEDVEEADDKDSKEEHDEDPEGVDVEV
jgi:hypothetical protein